MARDPARTEVTANPKSAKVKLNSTTRKDLLIFLSLPTTTMAKELNSTPVQPSTTRAAWVASLSWQASDTPVLEVTSWIPSVVISGWMSVVLSVQTIPVWYTTNARVGSKNVSFAIVRFLCSCDLSVLPWVFCLYRGRQNSQLHCVFFTQSNLKIYKELLEYNFFFFLNHNWIPTGKRHWLKNSDWPANWLIDWRERERGWGWGGVEGLQWKCVA